jgi:hypothetical protein
MDSAAYDLHDDLVQQERHGGGSGIKIVHMRALAQAEFLVFLERLFGYRWIRNPGVLCFFAPQETSYIIPTPVIVDPSPDA